jgi:two-component system sensor histidine kinase BaeS
MRLLANMSIRAKLYMALLTTASLVTLALLFFMQYSSNSFVSYVEQLDSRMLKQLAVRLEARYAQAGQGGWAFLGRDFQNWVMEDGMQPPLDMAFGGRRDAAGILPRPPPMFGMPLAPLSGDPGPAGPRPGFMPVERFESRLVLRGPDAEFIAGAQREAEPQHSIRLMQDATVIGWLELLPLENADDIPALNLFSVLNDAPPVPYAGSSSTEFLTIQMRIFLTLVTVSLATILLLGVPLTRHFTKRIDTLFAAADQLSRGDFSTRVAIKGKDELAQLGNRFNYLAEALQRNKETQQTWVSNISHELRTPLGILKGELEAMQDGVRQTDAAQIAMLSTEVAQLNTLINDLFELSRADVGGLAYNKASIPLIPILEGSLARFRESLQAKGIEIVEHIAHAQKPQIFGDTQRLGQLFSNLIQNSLKYTNANGNIFVTLNADAEHIYVSIEDSSPGVTTPQLGRLFERFYRAEQSRSRNTGGAGLGLAICKTIVEAHKGSIVAQHSLLGGLAIHLRFPRIS